MSDKVYLFIIDTDSYSGNFERDMCAYITGKAGDCETEWAKMYIKEKDIKEDDDFNEHILSLPNEHGCYLPCAIWSSPGWVNDGNGKHIRINSPAAKKLKAQYPAYNSVAIFMEREPTKDEISEMKQRAQDFVRLRVKSDKPWNKERIKIESFRLLLRETKETLLSQQIK